MHTSDVRFMGFDPSVFDEPQKKSRETNLSSFERGLSVASGAALLLLGLSRRSGPGAIAAAAGGLLVYRGATGVCPVYKNLGISTATESGLHVTLDQSITILRPIDEVYTFYRNFENLPRFMKHLREVQQIGADRSRWMMQLPGGRKVEWMAKIIEEQPNELIRWRSLEGSDLDHYGEVRFRMAPAARGTEVHVIWKYVPPGKAFGAIFAKLADVVSQGTLEQELRRFKQVMETGEISTTEGQSSGRRKVSSSSRAAVRELPPAFDELEMDYESEIFGFEADETAGDMERERGDGGEMPTLH